MRHMVQLRRGTSNCGIGMSQLGSRMPGLAVVGVVAVVVVVMSGCSRGATTNAADSLDTQSEPVAGSVSAVGEESSVVAASSNPSRSSAPGSAQTTTANKDFSAKQSAKTVAVPAKFGNPAGGAPIPAPGRAVNTSRPTTVVGNGTPASCTSRAVVAAVARGGVITFSCGPHPVTITMAATAIVRNKKGTVVIDGGGKVTLSGGDRRRILLQDTCNDAYGKGEPNCTQQSYPRLVVQNLTLANATSVGQPVPSPWSKTPEGGGGAMFVRGGQLSVINTRFVNNRCETTGPDIGGAGIRALDMYRDGPVYVVNSTFEGGRCSNGGGTSSIGVSWEILNSLFRNNNAVGRGANPAKAGTPGGGSGAAMYLDGNTYRLRLAGTRVENNTANEGGGAIFFVSNDRTGTLRIETSHLLHNPSHQFETPGLPGIFYLGNGKPVIAGSVLRK